MSKSNVNVFLSAAEKVIGKRGHRRSDVLGMDIYWSPADYETVSKIIDLNARGRTTEATVMSLYYRAENESGDRLFGTASDLAAIKEGVAASSEIAMELAVLYIDMAKNEGVTDRSIKAAKGN